MVQSASVEALLTLNAQGFDKGIESAITNVDKLVKAVGDSKTTISTFERNIRTLQTTLADLGKASTVLDPYKKSIETFNSLANAMERLVRSAREFEKTGAVDNELFKLMGNAVRQFMDALGGANIKLTNVIEQTERLVTTTNKMSMAEARVYSNFGNGYQNYLANINQVNTALSKSINDINQYQTKVSETSAKQSQLTASTNQTTNALNKQATATKNLSSTMSSLRMIGTMVGSMFAWNFAHNLYVATSETIKARSEMYSMFETMNMTKSQIGGFNQALDDTAKRFQRINKYMIGETVASIGVEFKLSTEQMKKALSVTSMITSEYLRAGRNTSEASLAVKDIMQGEFQRLSRETGVKGEQLKEAGWSGDKTDVMSLLNALEKVAKARHWDVFAEKANSLQDIIQITQNRISEAVADISERYIPVIVNGFNFLVDAVRGVSIALTSLFSWLNQGGWLQMATDVGLVTTALTVGLGALVAYRTGAGLLQVAEMGLRGTIMATIFALDAETVAQVGSTRALAAKLTGLTAENIGEMNLSRAIATRVLGLNAESVAQLGVKGAIMQSVLVRKVEEIAVANVDTKTKMAMITEAQERISKMNTLSVIFAKIAGLNLETLEQHGLRVALLESVTATDAQTASNMGLLASIGALSVAILPYIAVIVALGVAIGVVAKKIMDSADVMKKFNNIMDDSEAFIKKYQNQVDYWKKREEQLQTALNNTAKGTKQYTDTLLELQEASDNAKTAQENLKTAIEGVRKAQKMKDWAEQNKLNKLTEQNKQLEKQMQQQGFKNPQISSVTSQANQLAAGTEKIYKAQQVYNWQTGAFLRNEEQLAEAMGKANVKSGERIHRIKELQDAYSNLREHTEIANTSDDGWEIFWNKLYARMDQMRIDWINFWASFEVNPFETTFKALIDNWGGGVIPKAKELFNFDDFKTPFIQFDNWLKENFTLDHFASILGEGSFNLFSWLFPDDAQNQVREKLANLDLASIFVEWANILVEWQTNLQNSLINMGTNLWNYAVNVGNSIINGVCQAIANGLISIYNAIINVRNTMGNTMNTWISIGINKATQMVNGVVSFVSQLPNRIYNEFAKIPPRIEQAIPYAVSKAKDYGNAILKAALGAMGINSPGIVQNKITAEFQDTVSNIGDTVESARSVGADFGSAITGAVTDNLTGGFIMDYRGDAGQINAINQSITSDTASTFTDLGLTVDGTISTMSSNIATNYTNMNMTQSTMLNGMATQNKTAFNNIQTQTNTSLKNMRDSTSNVTLQMTRAWSTMKDNIVASANQLKTQSTAHFNTLSTHIGTFYRKLQNPSMWGAGDKVPTRYYNSARGNRGRTAVRRHFGLGGGFAGGVGQANLPRTMSLKRLRQMMGDSPIFDGLDLNQVVDVVTFLSNFDGGFGWNTWHSKHFNKIKTTTGDYNMKSPQIMHRINTSATFHPKEFYNGRPSVSFGQFQSMAESLFSAIPYDFYYNSDKYGSWVNALNAGACNCYDGASALIALASTCGFGGYMASGTWNGIPHVYAVINGRKMDTTGWQQRRNWNGVSAGGDVKGVGQTTVNITVDMSNSNIYGVDELDSRIENGVNKAMQKSINPSKIIGY